MLGFIWLSDFHYIVIFSALLNAVAVLFSLPQKVISDNVLHQLPDYQNIRSEYMVIREWFMTFGWILSFSAIYFIGSLDMQKVQFIFLAMV